MPSCQPVAPTLRQFFPRCQEPAFQGGVPFKDLNEALLVQPAPPARRERHPRRFNSIIEMEADMKVSEAMTPDVQIASPNQSIQEAAKMMAAIDAGVLPVGDNDRLVGMITDRDIVVRAVAKGLSPSTKIRDVMSNGSVMYCFEDEEVEEVAHNMADIKVRRLPVLNRKKRLVGIVSLGDIAMTDSPDCAGETMCAIAEPGGPHSQASDGRG